MPTDEEINRITTRLKGAFKPLRCVVEIWDYKHKLRFKIFDQNDQSVIEVPEVILRHLANQNELQTLIENVREEVQKKGFVLE